MKAKKFYIAPAMETTKLITTNAILESSNTTLKAKQIETAFWDEE